ncbi:MAG: VOC family protein [Hamadaea sp.]|nr:VOC family protein [Hamadaea sp.]
MMGKLSEIVIDTPDVVGLSAFYRDLAGFEVVRTDDDWITTKTPEGWKVAFQLAPGLVAPRWPDPAYPQQMHLDLVVTDLPAAVEKAEKLGATRLPGGGETFTVFADPSGHPFCLCQRDGVDGVGLADLMIDSPDGATLARFYAELLGMKTTYEGPEGAMISADDQPAVCFQNVGSYTAPQWPDPAYPQQYHLDVEVADADEGERQVLALGATRLPGGGEDFRVFADPVGHPFCLVW